MIDGNYFLHLAIPYNPADKTGPHISSYNFIRHLGDWISRLNADRVIVCWDNGIPERRKKLCPSYKTNRVNKSDKDRARHEEFGQNKEILLDILPKLKVRMLSSLGFEADDLIYGLSVAASGRVMIVSGDMDLAQLVNEKVSLHIPGKKKIDHQTISSVVVDEDRGLAIRNGHDLIAFKAMRGDSSDNISPVVKPKTTCIIWTTLMEANARMTLANIREVAKQKGIDIDPRLEVNYSVVDLARSGVAAEAIELASGALLTPVMMQEDLIFKKFLDLGMQTTYIHRIIQEFYRLT